MRYVALYPFYVVCVAGVLFRGVAQTSGKAARLNGEKLVLTLDQGGAHDSNSARYLFRVPMIHRFMTSHPVAKLLLCFRAKHQDGRPMPFGFFVILTNRLTELCILNAENVEKVSSRPFKQMS